MTTFYRFRRIENLLGTHQELERQSIFFASPAQLNDPMEGFRNIYWQGDRIAWTNLFRHYLRCLERAYCLLVLAGEDHHSISAVDLPIFWDGSSFPTEEARKLFEEIVERFFGKAGVVEHIEAITSHGRKVRRSELQWHLWAIHLTAVEVLAECYEAHDLIPKRNSDAIYSGPPIGRITDDLYKSISRSTTGLRQPEMTEAMFAVLSSAIYQTMLIQRHNGAVDTKARNRNFVYFDFSEAYVRGIERLVFPDWYTACFMSECTNSAVWGHYGDHHRGVCLIFRGEEVNDQSFLPLKGIIGWSNEGSVVGTSRMLLRPIEYVENAGDIDFFRSIGRLSMSALNSMWYRDRSGAASNCIDDLARDEKSWRDRYWRSCYRDLVRKTVDWEYEKEHRLIITDGIGIDFSSPADRIYTYEFSSLAGLIFGINTSIDDKLAIMSIIDRKCAASGRTDFTFYQAVYLPHTGQMQPIEMSLLKSKP